MDIKEISTIQDHIDYGRDLEISHSKLHLKAKIKNKYGDNIIHSVSSLITKYFDYVRPTIVKYQLNEEEYMKYRYRPKALSLDQYGTTELWSSLLNINHMTSVTQFNKRTINVFNNNIMDVIEEILILEEDNIRKNNAEIEKDI